MPTRLGPHEPLDVAKRILVVRRERVLLDSDLAALYGVPTHRLNEAVKRNIERFPEDFAFQLTAAETIALISQTAISKKRHGGRRKPAWAFTEHGAIMLASLDRETRERFEEVHQAIKALTKPPQRLSRQIGFTAPTE